MTASASQNTIINPYAAPQSDVVAPTDDNMKYDGKLLAVTHPAVLPHVCIKCGAPCDDKQKTKKLSWASPWWFLSFFLIGIFFLIVYLLVSKRLTVSYSLCPEHKEKQKKKSILMWSGFSLAAALMIIGNILNTQGQAIGSTLLVVGITIFVIFLLLALFLPRVIIIRKAKHSKQVSSKRPYIFFLGGIDKSFADAAKIDKSQPN